MTTDKGDVLDRLDVSNVTMDNVAILGIQAGNIMGAVQFFNVALSPRNSFTGDDNEVNVHV